MNQFDLEEGMCVLVDLGTGILSDPVQGQVLTILPEKDYLSIRPTNPLSRYIVCSPCQVIHVILDDGTCVPFTFEAQQRKAA